MLLPKVHSLEFSPGVIHPMGLHQSMTHIYHYRVILLWKSSVLWLFTSLSPLTSGNHWSFTASTVLPFPECHIVATKEHVAVADCLPSPRNMHSNFSQVFHGSIVHFFQHWIIFHCLDISQFIYYSIFTIYWSTAWLFPSFDNYE